MHKTDEETGNVAEIDREIAKVAGLPAAHLASTINGLLAGRGGGSVGIALEELARIEETTPEGIDGLLAALRSKMPGHPMRRRAVRDGHWRTVGFLVDSLVPVMAAGRPVLQIVEDPNVR